MFTHNFFTPPKMIKVTGADGKRFYTTPEGKKYESVTTYLGRLYAKPELHKWKKRVGATEAAKVQKSTSGRGNSLHKAVENYLLNTPVDLSDSPVTKGLFNKIKPLVDNINNIRLLETALWSDELELAGTPDTVADWCDPPWEADLSIIDYKSKTKILPKKFYVDYYLQCACYSYMVEQHIGLIPKWAILVMASADVPEGVVYKIPMTDCRTLLSSFRRDPVAFAALQVKMKGKK